MKQRFGLCHIKVLALAIVMLLGMLVLPMGTVNKPIWTAKVEATGELAEVNWTKFEDIRAEAIFAYNATKGQVLVDNKGDAPIFPASTTKLLTALTVVQDQAYDPNKMITATAADLKMPDASFVTASIVEGEAWRTEDLLKVLLVASANDAANVLGTGYGPTRETFMTKINAKAKAIGMTKTNFENPSGIHTPNHKTTARDMTLLLNEVLKQPTLAKIIKMSGFASPQTNKHTPQGWDISTQTNLMLLYDSDLLPPYYVENLGGKTGTTDEAGRCLITAAKAKNGDIIIGAIYGASLVKGQKINVAVMMRALLVEAAQKAGLELISTAVPTTTSATTVAKSTSTLPQLTTTESTNIGLGTRITTPSLWTTETHIIIVLGVLLLICGLTILRQRIQIKTKTNKKP